MKHLVVFFSLIFFTSILVDAHFVDMEHRFELQSTGLVEQQSFNACDTCALSDFTCHRMGCEVGANLGMTQNLLRPELYAMAVSNIVDNHASITLDLFKPQPRHLS